MDLPITIISAMGAIVMICITIIGWFMMASLKESRQNTLDIGILRGTIESNREKSKDDVEGLSNETNIKIQHLTDQTMMLGKNIDKLLDLVLNTQFNKGK